MFSQIEKMVDSPNIASLDFGTCTDGSDKALIIKRPNMMKTKQAGFGNQ